MDVIDSNYIEMFPITTRNDEEIKKSFDSLNDHNYYDFNFDINKRDENGNSLLHRLIIDSVDENDAINKFLNLPFNVASLYNTQNNDLQTPLHLICIKRYQELFNVMINKDRTRRTIIKDVLDNIKRHDKDYSNIIFKNKPLKDSFGLFNYSIQDKYGNIPIVYLLNGYEISYENIDPEAIFKKIIKDELTFNYQDDNYLLFHNNNFEFRLIDSNLKGFIDTLQDNTNTNTNLNRYRFNSSPIISIQSFKDNIDNKNKSEIYYGLLINYLINKKINYSNKEKINNYLNELSKKTDHNLLFNYLNMLEILNKSIYNNYINMMPVLLYNEYIYDYLVNLIFSSKFYFYYLIYTFIVKNPYTEIIHDIITIPEFQEVISDDKLTKLFVNMGDNSLIELVRKFIIENKAPAPAGRGYYIKGGDSDDLIDKLQKNIIIHPVSINKNNDNIAYEKIKFKESDADKEIEINIIDFIPIFTLCAKLYNKYQNKGDDVISQYLRLNDITNGEQFIKTNMPDPSKYNKGMLNIYILNMIFTVYYLLLLEQVVYCVNYNHSIMIDALKKYNVLMEITKNIKDVIDDKYIGKSTTDRLNNLISNLENGKIDNTIISELKSLFTYEHISNDNLKNNIDNYYKEATDYGTTTDTNRLSVIYHKIAINDKRKNSIDSINTSIENFNNNINLIFKNDNQYKALFKDNTVENYKLKDVDNDNYYDKIKDLFKLIKQIQNNLLENVFKIDKETIKKRLQNIFSELNLCVKYDADDKSKGILDSLNDVKFTNSFKSLVDNLTAQSEDFQNIYKSNINKFNNIILQNISILTEKH